MRYICTTWDPSAHARLIFEKLASYRTEVPLDSFNCTSSRNVYLYSVSDTLFGFLAFTIFCSQCFTRDLSKWGERPHSLHVCFPSRCDPRHGNFVPFSYSRWVYRGTKRFGILHDNTLTLERSVRELFCTVKNAPKFAKFTLHLPPREREREKGREPLSGSTHKWGRVGRPNTDCSYNAATSLSLEFCRFFVGEHPMN